MINILIGGDVCPIKRNQESFIKGEALILLNNLLMEFQSADLSIVNLESPLIRKETPVLKSGPVLGADCRSINAFKKAGIKAFNLANNHIMDHGSAGLENIISVCKEAGLSVVVAGRNIEEAGKILEYEIKNKKIGIFSFAEHECSIASKTLAGANPLNIIEYMRKMRHYKEQSDYIIVLLHGGKEYHPYPTPQLQQICRFMVEEGAKAVICQHSHCAGAYENYRDGHIIYGQGNLIFDAYPRMDNIWCNGYLVNLSIREDNTSEMSIIPYIQSDAHIGARRMQRDEETNFLNELKKKSKKVEDIEFVKKEWDMFCKDFRYTYFSIFRGHNKLFRFLNRWFHFSDIFYSKKSIVVLQNIIRCESHREAVLSILSEVK